MLAVVLSRDDPTTGQVKELLLATNIESGREFLLIQMGPKAIPALRRMVTYHETPLHVRYNTIWKSLPAWSKKYLPDPVLKRNLRQRAISAVSQAGPSLARPLASALCEIPADADSFLSGSGIAALNWSVPESPRAIARIEEWLADPGQPVIRFAPQTLDEDMWAFMPAKPKLYMPWLRNPGGVPMACAALGFMGSNAAPAIPMLVEVCDFGVASPPIAPVARMPLPAGGTPLLLTNGIVASALIPNRPQALAALGQIGIASPEVLAAMNRGIADSNLTVQLAAFQALHRLHQPLEPAFTNWLSGFRPTNSRERIPIVRWLGTLGSEGRETVPWLKEMLATVAATPGPEPIVIAGVVQPMDNLRQATVCALCQLEPGEVVNYATELASMGRQRPEALDLLLAAKESAATITKKLEPQMREQAPVRAAIAAYVILGLAPNNAEAKATLHKLWEEDLLNERIVAATWLWRRTGEYKLLLALCREGMQSGTATVALNALGEIASKVPEAIPLIAVAIKSPNQTVRYRAWQILRKIAPKELPPVS
jgi:hypothetical protein